MIPTLILAVGCVAQCPGGLCPPGVCSPCGEVIYGTQSPVRYVSQSNCVPTGYGGGDVLAQLVAQQERMEAQVRSLSEDLATIRWQFTRPIARAAPMAVPSKQQPVPETFASPQAPTPYEAPQPPPVRKMPPLPSIQSPPPPPPPQADAADRALQWQCALQAGRYRVGRERPPARLGAAPGPDRTPFSLD